MIDSVGAAIKFFLPLLGLNVLELGYLEIKASDLKNSSYLA